MEKNAFGLVKSPHEQPVPVKDALKAVNRVLPNLCLTQKYVSQLRERCVTGSWDSAV